MSEQLHECEKGCGARFYYEQRHHKCPSEWEAQLAAAGAAPTLSNPYGEMTWTEEQMAKQHEKPVTPVRRSTISQRFIPDEADVSDETDPPHTLWRHLFFQNPPPVRIAVERLAVEPESAQASWEPAWSPDLSPDSFRSISEAVAYAKGQSEATKLVHRVEVAGVTVWSSDGVTP